MPLFNSSSVIALPIPRFAPLTKAMLSLIEIFFTLFFIIFILSWLLKLNKNQLTFISQANIQT